MNTMRHMKKWICILFALAITISGMCFDTIKADSSFYCIEQAGSSEISYVSTVFEQNKDLCTCELLGIEKGQGSIVTRGTYKTKNNSAKLFMVHSFAAILPENTFYKKEVINRFLCKNVISSLYNILCYIHHQDGSKD